MLQWRHLKMKWSLGNRKFSSYPRGTVLRPPARYPYVGGGACRVSHTMNSALGSLLVTLQSLFTTHSQYFTLCCVLLIYRVLCCTTRSYGPMARGYSITGEKIRLDMRYKAPVFHQPKSDATTSLDSWGGAVMAAPWSAERCYPVQAYPVCLAAAGWARQSSTFVLTLQWLAAWVWRGRVPLHTKNSWRVWLAPLILSRRWGERIWASGLTVLRWLVSSNSGQRHYSLKLSAIYLVQGVVASFPTATLGPLVGPTYTRLPTWHFSGQKAKTLSWLLRFAQTYDVAISWAGQTLIGWKIESEHCPQVNRRSFSGTRYYISTTLKYYIILSLP